MPLSSIGQKIAQTQKPFQMSVASTVPSKLSSIGQTLAGLQSSNQMSQRPSPGATISQAPETKRAPFVQIAQAVLPKPVFKSFDEHVVQPFSQIKPLIAPTFADQMKSALKENRTQTTSQLVSRAKELDTKSGLARVNGGVAIDITGIGGSMKRVESNALSAIGNKIAPAFKNFEDLSTKLLGKLEGKTKVSKQFISDLTNSGDLKQPERDLFRNLLDGEGDTINVPDFANKVKSELLPLKAIGDIDKGETLARYENITLPSELRGDVKDYTERIYESPIKTSAGDVHFGESPMGDEGGLENYFGHTRIEDMADNQTRRVIEAQSDLFQKGRLEGNVAGAFENIPTKAQIKSASAPLEPYRNTWHERIVREEVKKAAQDGKTKLQFPTGETAMKIEGLGDKSSWSLGGKQARYDGGAHLDMSNYGKLKVGSEVSQSPTSQWIITNVLGDGKFKAVPKRLYDNAFTDEIKEVTLPSGNKGYQFIAEDGRLVKTNSLENAKKGIVWKLDNLASRSEQFDISGKVDQNNPIYKFYEKEMGKYLKNKYGATLVTDKQGVTWYEVQLDKSHANRPVEAFAGGITGMEEDDDGNMHIDPLKAGLGILGIHASKKIGNKLGEVRKTNQTSEGLVPQKSQSLSKALPKSAQVFSSDISKIANTNLNVNNLNVSPESKALITKTVEEVKPLIEKSVGKSLSNQEAIDLAERSSKVLTKAIGREETLAWESSMLKARQALSAASENGTVDETYIRNLLVIKTQGTDIARKLQSLSIKADAMDTTPKEAILEAVLKVTDDIDAVIKASKGVDFTNLKEATEFYRTFIKPTKSEWFDLIRYNSMLSSPKTHIINIFSNLLNSSVVAPLEKALTGGLDFLASSVTGNARQYYAGEGGAYLANYLSSTKEAVKRLSEVMKGERAYTNLDTRYIPLATKGVKGAVVKALSVPTKVLEGMDQFFMALAEGGQKGALNYRASKGVTVGNIATEATKDANYRLFRQKPLDDNQGPLLDAVDQFTVMVQAMRNNKNPIVSNVAKFTVPFVQTPMNIFKQGIEYSPVGLGTIPGAKNKTEQLSKAIIGSSIFAGAATLLMSNRLTWGEPINTKQKNDYRAAGMQPYSVKIGNTWYSYQKLPPTIAFPLAMVAAINDTKQSGKTDDDTISLVLTAIAKYGSFLSEQSYAKSIGDLLSAVKGGEEGLARVAGNYVQQLVPYRAFGGWLARLTDDVQRQVDNKGNFVDKQVQLLMMNIPGLSKKVPARKDSQGIEVLQDRPVLNALSPIQTRRQHPDDAARFEGLLKLRKEKAAATAVKSEAKDKVRPVYDQVQALKMQPGTEEQVQQIVDALSPEDYELYKSIRSTDRAKHTETTRDKLAVDPADAVQYVRSLPPDEINRIVNLLTPEEYALYEQGKPENNGQ